MNLAWIDLETTNADEETGSIIEIGLTITDTELNPLHGWETLVEPDITHVAEMPEKVREMHTRSGLLDELDALTADLHAGRDARGILTLEEADRALAQHLGLWVVDPRPGRGRVALAGSGVGHFDGRWIRRHLPRSAELLTYWTVDVGVVRRWLSMIVGADIPSPQHDDKPHRGQADVRLHLREARIYRDAMRAAVSVLNIEMARPRPGDRAVDGGEPGTLVRCDTCSGDGLLHVPDRFPEIVEPEELRAPDPTGVDPE